MTEKAVIEEGEEAAGGWGSVRAVAGILFKEQAVLHGLKTLGRQNKPDGYACVSCSWAKPATPHPFEFCENGAKATAWELTSRRVTPEFFAEHSVKELLTWRDFDLENAGRLTAPLRWNPQSDHLEEVTWGAAFAEIGEELKALAPESVVFYASGRASLETTYMYQLMARMYGCNNLPDSSNMCHESTSVGLQKAIGVGVGTVQLEDFDHTDCIFFFGQNVGTNSPRMLHDLQECRERGVPIIVFNPIREPGLVEFVNPQSPAQMLSGSKTVIATQYHQLKVGGDIAALTGLCKAVVEADDAARSSGKPRVLDVDFIEQHTHGFGEFLAYLHATPWESIESESSLTRAAIERAAAEYCRASAVMGIYGMGLTQHRRGVENVQMVCNLLLLRGNIGKPGAGPCPVRGHSNVQGQRTVGMTEKPELAPLDKLEELYRFTAPRTKGLNTVEACEGILDGSVKAFVGLGGNFIRAVPDTDRIEPAWTRLRLTVQIATKLNRNHLVHGEVAYVLPCLGRIEIDRQASGEQAVSMEDSTGCFHGSRGQVAPASDKLLSEAAIVAGIAKATLAPNPMVDWDAWVGDYSKVRDAIEATYPDIFRDFNERMWTPGGFHRPLPAANRIWKTETKKANFIVPGSLKEDDDLHFSGQNVLRLMTLRTDDQFNTTIYSLNDRFRGIYGTRMVLLMNANDIERLGLVSGETVSARTVSQDGIERRVDGFRVTPYDIPAGCVAGYYPECNPLVPLSHHAKGSKVPASKSIPIELARWPANPA